MFKNFSGKISMNVKQWASYLVIILFFIIITEVSYLNSTSVSKEISMIGESDIPKMVQTGELKEQLMEIRLEASQLVYSTDESEQNELNKLVNQNIEEIDNEIAGLEKLAATEEEKRILKEFNENFTEYTAFLQSYINEIKVDDSLSTPERIKDLSSAGEEALTTMDALVNVVSGNTDTKINELVEGSNRYDWKFLALSVLGSLFSLLIAFFMTKLIRRSVIQVEENVANATHSVAEIKNTINQTATNSKLLDTSMINANDSVNHLVASIQQVAGNANDSSHRVDDISAAIEEMSASINLVAGSANELTASAEETSAAIQEMMASIEQVAANSNRADQSVHQVFAEMEEMSTSIKGVSENAIHLTNTAEHTYQTVEEMLTSIKQVASAAGKVNQLSNGVKEDAFEGSVTLKETLSGMKEIVDVIHHGSNVMESLRKSSQEIGSIIEVIDEIADQTNLLALNAAIEAARAGEHGKGFAVVAEEVRKLAERSANATKEITGLIKGIQEETTDAVASINAGVQKVETGNELADKANQAFKKIVQGIEQVTAEMNGAVAATEEQTRKSEVISKAMESTRQQTSEMTKAIKEQSTNAEEIVKGITETREQVQQISIATSEQAQGSQAIITAIENVTHQSSSVTSATKEQALTSEEIVQNVNMIKVGIQQMTAAANEQAQYGQEIAEEVVNVRQKTEELNDSMKTQAKEVEEVVHSVTNVSQAVIKLK